MSNILPLAGGSSLAPVLALTGTPADAVVGKGYFFRPAPAGGAPGRPLTFTLSAGTLPEGFTFSSHTGTIRGSATTAGTTSGLAITVTDGFSTSAPLAFSLVIAAPAVAPGGGGGVVTPQALALGDTIGFLGCSVDADSNWNGLVPAFLRRMNHRLQASPYGYYGWPSTRPDEWGIQLPGLLSTKPAVMWVGDWVNSTTPGTTYTLQSQTDKVEDYMQQFGALSTSKLILLTTSRKTDNVVTAGRVALLDSINAWCAAQDGRVIGNARVKFLNAPYDITTGGVDTLCTRDKTHDNTRGAIFNRGKRYFDAVSSLLPAGRTLPVSGSVPVSNLTTNPLFTGSGTVTATGAGAANVTGTIATGYGFTNLIASGVNFVLDASNGRQRVTISGNQPATSDAYMTVNVAGLLKGKKYIVYAHSKISGADGVSSGTPMRNYSILPGLPDTGSDGKGSLIIGDGDTPQPYRDAARPINPITGAADEIGENWFVTRPVTCPVSGTSTFRLYLTPQTGTVDVMVDFTDFFVVEFTEPLNVPYYQAQRYARGDGTFNRFYPRISGLYTSGGFFPSNATPSTSRLLTQTAANSNNSWIFQYGDFSGGNLTYDGTVEVQKSGSGTWTQVVASLLAASWTWNATGYGLAAGDAVRSTITATNTLGSATAVETITIT